MVAATCACGDVEITLTGAPIMTAECGCGDCQAAGRDLGVLSAWGTTAYTVMRKDRVRLLRGAEHLRARRLRPGSRTRRVVATCCDTPVYLEFEPGHWLSVYRDRIAPGERAPITLRTMTKRLPDPAALPADGVQNARTYTFGFVFALLWAWVAMGCRAPRIDWLEG